MPDSVEKSREAVWQIVHAIPHGRVATYGQIARIAGMPQQSRLVGKILRGLPNGTKIPWHRVINSQGKISNPNPSRQAELLASEGVILLNGRVSLAHYQWQAD
ncbi:MAG: methylated-DNA-protein-cysteine methyltransferase-like protein [Candidatus Azotimanducaceae bacterium]|jgi:methylated-DNA-protein-cysteine methyltransferase-like protein